MTNKKQRKATKLSVLPHATNPLFDTIEDVTTLSDVDSYDTAALGAFGVLSTVCGRSYLGVGISPRNPTYTNLFMLGLGRTGMGKEVISKTVNRLRKLRLPNIKVTARITSVVGIHKACAIHDDVVVLGYYGEAQENMSRSDSHIRALNALMLSLYSNSVIDEELSGKSEKDKLPTVLDPRYISLSVTQPETYLEFISDSKRDTGELGRTIYFPLEQGRTRSREECRYLETNNNDENLVFHDEVLRSIHAGASTNPETCEGVSLPIKTCEVYLREGEVADKVLAPLETEFKKRKNSKNSGQVCARGNENAHRVLLCLTVYRAHYEHRSRIKRNEIVERRIYEDEITIHEDDVKYSYALVGLSMDELVKLTEETLDESPVWVKLKTLMQRDIDKQRAADEEKGIKAPIYGYWCRKGDIVNKVAASNRAWRAGDVNPIVNDKAEAMELFVKTGLPISTSAIVPEGAARSDKAVYMTLPSEVNKQVGDWMDAANINNVDFDVMFDIDATKNPN